MKNKSVQALLATFGLKGGSGFYGYTDATLDAPITFAERDRAIDSLIAEAVRKERVKAFVAGYREATYGEEWR